MSQKRKQKERKRKKKNRAILKKKEVCKRTSSRNIEMAITIDTYLQTPSFNHLNQLLNTLNSNSDYDELYKKTVDDSSVFQSLSKLEIATIFYVSERCIESIGLFQELWKENQCLISLNYLFLAAIDRSDLNLANEILVEIEARPQEFEAPMVNAYRMMYGLTSGLNDYAESIATYSLNNKFFDKRIMRLILQTASRVGNGRMIATVLSASCGPKLLSELGKQQKKRIDTILKNYLLKLLREMQ